jgi:SAM-dependent methyltransferase
MSDVYEIPKYYEIAFSWRDISAEVDLFENCFRHHSNIRVKKVFELGCGNSPHMVELVKRGYDYSGLDLNDKMLDYSREKAEQNKIKASLIRGNMIDFNLDGKIDFAFIMLGSLFATSTSDLISHFGSVARALKIGGLYLLDWCVQFEPPWETKGESSWEMEQGGIKVKTIVDWKPINLARQTFEETIRLDIDDHGKKFSISGKDVHRAIYPQEFLRFIENHEQFEFVGWWNNWNLDNPLDNALKISRPIILIRRI